MSKIKLAVTLTVIMVLSGCGFTSLPKAEPKKEVTPEAPQKGIFDDATQKRKPEDPNRSILDGKVSANPDIVNFPVGTKQAAQITPSAETKPAMSIVTHWEELMEKYKLVDESKAADRLKEIIALEGNKGAEKIAGWVKKLDLTDLLRGILVKIQTQSTGELNITYTAFLRIPNVDAKANIKVFPVNFVPAKAVKLEDLKNEIELIPQVSSPALGKVTIRALNLANDFYIKHEKNDEGFAFVVESRPDSFGDIAPIVQLVGYEDSLADSVFAMNFTTFEALGKNKVAAQLTPLATAIKKMRTLAEQNKRLQELKIAEKFVNIDLSAIGKENGGALGFTLEMAQNSLDLNVSIRSVELDGEKYVEILNSNSLPVLKINKIVELIDSLVKEIGDRKAELMKLAHDDKTVDVKDLISAATSFKFDHDGLLEGLQFMAKDIKN